MRSPSFFLCHTTGEALVTPLACTGSRTLRLTISCSFAFTSSCIGYEILRALQKGGWAPGFRFTWALYPLTVGNVSESSFIASITMLVRDRSQGVQNPCSIAQLPGVASSRFDHSMSGHKRLFN